ncbi:MAG: KpsF/GutQ family sugar-phosphate isomerase [Oscillospiraceae bacterium]|jgi:arabinose-5-phosphate isomerase|nr:KpsF/GutQ family sugar-phosphate isomerase [Oscillospiraceae bacterium]
MDKNIDIICEGKQVFDTEIEALNNAKNAIDSSFVKIVELIVNCTGKVVITGMGKPGHIGKKIAATMASLGTPSFFLHPAEAQHGDLGMLRENDIIIAFSFSGESEEITKLITPIKLIGATLVGVSGNKNSTLIKNCDVPYVFPQMKEACSMNLAPTSSTTVTLAFGDALAVCASKIYGFKEKNYALFHPAGSLGKKLLYSVGDLMKTGAENAVVKSKTSFKDAIVEMSSKALGIINIAEQDELLGIFTDGDLRRALSKGIDVYNVKIDELMVKNPITVTSKLLAVEALKLMNSKHISVLPVVDDGKLAGTIRINDITAIGIIAQ